MLIGNNICACFAGIGPREAIEIIGIFGYEQGLRWLCIFL